MGKSSVGFMKICMKAGKVLCLCLIAFTLAGCTSDIAGSDGSNKEGQDVIEAPEENGEDQNDAVSDDSEDGMSYGELSEGDKAPDFTADTVSGEKFTLSENSGKVVLINFWATWCGPCVGEMPAFERLNKEYGDDVEILCVNCVESNDTVDAFVKENGYTFPIAYDPEGEINYKYPTQGIPYTLVIGKDGIISAIYIGSEGEEEQYQKYKSSIDEALAK